MKTKINQGSEKRMDGAQNKGKRCGVNAHKLIYVLKKPNNLDESYAFFFPSICLAAPTRYL
jgi:hypothetical protein